LDQFWIIADCSDGPVQRPVPDAQPTGDLTQRDVGGLQLSHTLQINLPARASAWVLVLRGAFR
jgi:hypothetical protein